MSTAHDVDFHFAAPEGPAAASTHRVIAIRDQAGAEGDARPPHVADVAQARVFEDLLEAQLTELQAAFNALHDRWQRHSAKKRSGQPESSESLVRHREQLSELRCLLAALRARFRPITDQVISGPYADR